MKGSTQAALALGFGYMLGRRRKFRRAAIVAGAMATGGVGALGSTAMRRGAKALGSTDAIGKMTPQLGGIADAVRGPLLAAGKTAAVAVVSNRIDALSDSLHQRAEAVRDPGASVATVGDALGKRPRRQGTRADDSDDHYGDYDDQEDSEYEAEYHDEDAPNDRDAGDELDDGERDDDYDAEDEYEADDELDADDGLDEDRPADASSDATRETTRRRGDELEDDELEDDELEDDELEDDELEVDELDNRRDDDDDITDTADDDPEVSQRPQPQRIRRSPRQRRSPAESPVSRTRG